MAVVARTENPPLSRFVLPIARAGRRWLLRRAIVIVLIDPHGGHEPARVDLRRDRQPTGATDLATDKATS